MESLLIKYFEKQGFQQSFAEELAAVAEFKTIKGQEAVLDYGQPSEEIHLVLQGAFFSRHRDEESEKFRTVGFHLPTLQPFMAGIDSYFNGAKNTIRLEAARKSLVAVCEKDVAEEIMRKNKELESFYHQWIIDALTMESNLRMNLLTLSSTRFYQYLEDRYPQIIQEIPAKYIAEFMGISDVWLSKLKKERNS